MSKSDKVEYLSSDITQLRHGFFTRHGGVSSAPFNSLNAIMRVGDSLENVLENRKRALRALNLQTEDLAFLDMLEHGDKILQVTDAARGVDFDGYDAIMTNQDDIVLGISVADCPVVMLVSESDPALALVHSGWKGTYADVVPKTIEAMTEEYGVDPANIKAVIGPGISVESYEVGSDVVEKFDPRYIVEIDGVTHLDIALCIQDQLVESGVAEVDTIAVDTYNDDRFFSYRRDGGETGRFICVATL